MRHGGDLGEAERRYGQSGPGWLDLSTGVNPEPYPVAAIPSEAFSRLPSRVALEKLIEAARQAYGAPAGAGIAAAPGSQALLHALAGLFPRHRSAFVSPGYGGYREAWSGSGLAMAELAEPDPSAADLIVVGNPNNPDGRIWPQGRLLACAAALACRGGLLVVDEAFADAVPQASLARHGGEPGLLIVRSFGKFYGLPGLRLGFALGEPDIADRLVARLGPWSVGGPALLLGTRALLDRAWAAAARARLARSAARLDDVLERAGLRVLGGTPLFRLFECPDAGTLHDALARAGIWLRRFDEHPAWLRCGLPPDEQGWARLAQALAVGVEARPRRDDAIERCPTSARED